MVFPKDFFESVRDCSKPSSYLKAEAFYNSMKTKTSYKKTHKIFKEFSVKTEMGVFIFENSCDKF